MTTTLAYGTETVTLADLRPGDLVEYDLLVYKTFRRIRMVQPGGFTLLAVKQTASGWAEETVGLYYADGHAPVLRVRAGEV